MKTKSQNKCTTSLLAIVALSASLTASLAAGSEVVFSDNFEAYAKTTNQFPVPPFEGRRFLELSRAGGRPRITATIDPAQTSEATDEIRIEMAVRVDGGVFSLYPKAGDSDTGQIGFWGDHRVGVVDPTGNFWQFLDTKLAATNWNTVVIKYINGSGNWAISINGSAFESKASGGNGNVTGVRLQTDDSGTVSYSDVIVIRNQTKSTVLFSENFEKGSRDAAPASDAPQVGTWTAIVSEATLSIRSDEPIISFGTLNAPQVGSYVSASAQVSDASPPGARGGANYLVLDRTVPPRTDRARPAFTKTATAGNRDSVHAEAWILYNSGAVQFGLDLSGSGYDAIVTIFAGQIAIHDGSGHVDTGLTHTPGQWSKYSIDYAVGSSQITLTVNGNAAVGAIPPIAQVKGLWFETGDDNSLASVDDVVASITPGQPVSSGVLFKDGFERSAIGAPPTPLDAEAGSYSVVGTIVQVLSGASFDGPSAARSGDNYLVVDRASSGGRPQLSALFAGGAFGVKTNAFHIDFYRWQAATAGNLGNIALVNSTGFSPAETMFYGIGWEDLRWRYYNGSAYVDSGLTFVANEWNKVTMDWDGSRLLGRVNDGDPVELGLYGTAENTIDRLFFETSGPGTLFYLDDINATVMPIVPPATLVKSTSPKQGATGVSVNSNIDITLTDGTQQVQINSIQLFLNGSVVSPAVSQTDQDGIKITTITFDPQIDFPFGSTNTVKLVYNDNASPPNVTTNEYSFVAATGVTLFADNFEDSRQATNIIEFPAFQGTKFLEINRGPGRHPHLYAGIGESFASDPNDEISIQFAVRVDTGEVSLYPRDQSGGSTAATFDTGQLGFFADGRIGIVDDTGSFFQFLTQKLNPGVWNPVVVKYVNGSGLWSISVNGEPFESKSGKGSDGGGFGLNVAGFKVKCDAAGISYLDAFTVNNLTKGTLMFAANFDNGTIGEPPATTDPQVGTWSGITAPSGLIVHDAIARVVVTDAPPNAPQAGSYAAATALVEAAGAHSGTKSVYLYPALGHGEMRPRFTTPVPQGVMLHAEAWLYHVAQKMHFGLDTPADNLFVNVTLQPPNEGFAVTVFDGTSDADTGLRYTENTWERYQIDYVVGSNQLILTLNDQSVTLAVPVRNEVRGLWFVSGLPNDDFQSRGFVDDILASAPVVAPPQAPRLDFSRSGSQLTLSWNASGFVLQENDNLSNAAGWADAGNTSPAVITIGAARKFFRLKKP